MPGAGQQPRLSDWVAIPRYGSLRACIVALTCGHTRKIYEDPWESGALARAGCFLCGRVYAITEVQKLPLSCGNSPRVR